MSNTNLRIHPAIGIARVGNSQEYYLGPETMAGMPIAGQDLTGGLPIKPGTESTTITSNDLRDSNGKLKRQAARFKIFQYQYADGVTQISYPDVPATEVVIGSVVDGKTVSDIAWTVHLANKKANCWEEHGLDAYDNGALPPLRNPGFNTSGDPLDPANPERLAKLVIDAGPRAILASSKTVVDFDKTTSASYWNTAAKAASPLPNYPKSFPFSDGADGPAGSGSNAITSLGSITTEANGRLLVLGGFGLACGFDNTGNADPNAPLLDDVNNNGWIDDTGDGPVTAVLLFTDGSCRAIEGSAWVVSADPAYAPQNLNVVSCWDDVYTTWVEKFNLQPALYSQQKYNPNYVPNFESDVSPTLKAAALQMWCTNLPQSAINGHRNIGKLGAAAPNFDIMKLMRDPNADTGTPTNAPLAQNPGSPLMPLSLGTGGKSFLTVSTTQYFLMGQWAKNMCVPGTPATLLGPGEALDKTILFNCLGGRYSPGLELTFIVLDVNLYQQDWQLPTVGPFRINMQPLDYSKAVLDQPFLGVGYTPLRTNAVQPGDLCKFMAIPWHTDYNSCATHAPSPNPGGEPTENNLYDGSINTSLFWSWPAQRPVAVYTFADLAANGGNLPQQRYSVRGAGTAAQDHSSPGNVDTAAMNVGRFQERVDILLNWSRIGTMMQGPAIDGYKPHVPGTDSYRPDYYLEVQSQFDKDESNLVVPWPNSITDKVYPPRQG